MKYVIVTPAFNEEKNIALTIESVIVQTVKPVVWVIVDDGSTDRTAEIIKQYTPSYPWITYVYREKKPGNTYFASNVFALEKGIESIKNIDFDYIAILDADISLPENYYQNIIDILSRNKELGIAAGDVADRVDDKIVNHPFDPRSCAKAIMVFRRKCFEEIGGFTPMKYGGEDTIACFTARMKGWKTGAYNEFMVIHNKPLGMGYSKNVFIYRFKQGIGEYYLASPLLFLLLKSARRCIKESPYVIGGLLRIAGFFYALVKHEKRQISDELVRYIKTEQMGRVFSLNKIPDEFNNR